jgi:hypothetical protein
VPRLAAGGDGWRQNGGQMKLDGRKAGAPKDRLQYQQLADNSPDVDNGRQISTGLLRFVRPVKNPEAVKYFASMSVVQPEALQGSKIMAAEKQSTSERLRELREAAAPKERTKAPKRAGRTKR